MLTAYTQRDRGRHQRCAHSAGHPHWKLARHPHGMKQKSHASWKSTFMQMWTCLCWPMHALVQLQGVHE